MKTKINVSMILTYIYAFFLIYSPNLSYAIKINNFILLGMFTAIMAVITLPGSKKIKTILRTKAIVVFVIMTIFATSYFSVRTMLAGVDITNISELRIIQGTIPIMYLFGAILVYARLDKNNVNKYEFIINVAIIQSIICIIMVLIPGFKNIAINIFYSNHEVNKYITASRLYGICDGDYTYSFQIIQSIFALFSFIYANVNSNQKYYLFSVIILFSTILNGRWGIVIYAIGVVIHLLYKALIKGEIFKTLRISILLICAGAIGISAITKFLPNTVTLFTHAINDITAFLENGDKTETGRLVEMIVFPVGISIIFGCGYRIFGGKGMAFGFTKSSDVGFVNDMFMGGVVYMTLLYAPYMYMLRLINKSKRESIAFEKDFSKILLVSFLLANFKGEVFRSELLMTTLIILLTFMVLETRKGASE